MDKLKLKQAFMFAWQGLWYCLGNERNFKIHLVAFIMMVAVSWYLEFDRLELLLVLLVSAAVFTAELINTAIEKTLDLIEPNVHPIVKIAKDAAAAAVLVAAAVAAVTGCVLIAGKL